MLTRLIQVLLLLVCVGAPAMAADGDGYQVLPSPQPTQHADKVEVVEFFWYGCPHCYSLEPDLTAWVKRQPPHVVFSRQPAVFNETWGKHAKAYFIAEALGMVDKVHADLFDAIQNRKQKLDTQEALAEFFKAHGVGQAQFDEAFRSFAVDTKMRQAPVIAARHGITGVPTIVVNGKYVTSATIAGSHERMLEVMDALVKREHGAKKAGQ